MAVRSVLAGQKARPVWRMASGVGEGGWVMEQSLLSKIVAVAVRTLALLLSFDLRRAHSVWADSSPCRQCSLGCFSTFQAASRLMRPIRETRKTPGRMTRAATEPPFRGI